MSEIILPEITYKQCLQLNNIPTSFWTELLSGIKDWNDKGWSGGTVVEAVWLIVPDSL